MLLRAGKCILPPAAKAAKAKSPEAEREPKRTARTELKVAVAGTKMCKKEAEKGNVVGVDTCYDVVTDQP